MAVPTWRRHFLRRSQTLASSVHRTIYLNNAESNSEFQFTDNGISTTKYHWYSFLPKGLWEQFRRIANLYFLFHAILSLTPITPVSPVTTVLPLVFVVGVAMAKELMEDIQRGRQDRDTNQRSVKLVSQNGELEESSWRDLQVGNIIRVEDGDLIPADLLCLASSDSHGSCYVQTMNLDGETNLKMRNALEVTSALDPVGLSSFKGRVECEHPNASLYSFVGTLFSGEGEGEGTGTHGVTLSPSNILLRGCRLKNTKFVYGLVLYSGADTKVMKNSTDPPSKRSVLEKRLDYIIILELVLLVTMSLVTAVLFAVFLRQESTSHWYIQLGNPSAKSGIEAALFDWKRPVLAGLLQFFTSLVLYGYFVPISLYVSIEIVKLIQSKFINADRAMFYEEKGVPPRARTSNLNEELGMIQVILSDKTGTLTRNQMEFFKCSIAGVSYGRGVTEVERAAAERAGSAMDLDDMIMPADRVVEKGFNLRDPLLTNGRWIREPRPAVISRFLQVLSLCHTVVPEGDSDNIQYLAESPDESAFVVTAKRLGYFFKGRDATSATVSQLDVNGSVADHQYTILNTLEFTSARKRMSVVVRCPDGSIVLLCKGADSVIMERLSADIEAQEFVLKTQEHLTEYAEAGLRTLLIAWKEVDQAQYNSWQERWLEAKKDVSSVAAQVQKLEPLAEEMERGLFLLGATAIEDKLQEGVPQTIDNLARAGIRLWVLTGDKLETAVNIGYACSLLRHNMEQHLIFLEDSNKAKAEAEAAGLTVEQYSAKVTEEQILASKEAADLARSTHGRAASHALIIDGASLGCVLQDPGLRSAFLALAMECESVICCRVSPKQKAMVAQLVRSEGRQICLSIGDGANDVGMIQKANIGVGISGEEGQQAVMAADFSIGQFRFLERLLLVHGSWSYRRLSFMICFFFFKNFVFGFTVFYYNAIAQFSGASVYYDWYLSLYNVVFSAIPVCVVACIDQDVRPALHLRFPALYQEGQSNARFSAGRIALWLANGVYQSAAIFFVVLGAYWLESDHRDGRMADYLLIGTTMYTAVVVVVNIIFLICIQYWTWIHHLAVWGEIVVWIAYLLVWGAFPIKFSGVSKNLVYIAASSPVFYFAVLAATVAALLPDLVLRSMKRLWFPDDFEIVQEVERNEKRGKMAGEQTVDSGAVAPTDKYSEDFVAAETSSLEDYSAAYHSPLSLKASSFRESWSRRATDELTRKIESLDDDEEVVGGERGG